ncbi:uncharacterized protein EI90DRAFT_3127430 [Cantharellus anzutake]|uniref:uncharacterized protein n=1 Tax=Cantharellus anzutake TaxID=1750568 RepID=UPI0019070A34|nr:uncharacterized protein EI90DRAFT_3127430 [Cantharellus anzutake]KAF8326984.1 hypothetical protein EI90DRAFT_3127430 [Cantharellus anzutake]
MDTSCEIVVVADRDSELALKAVELITGGQHGKVSEGPNGKTIPWIITNKYYTAAVHFFIPPPIGENTLDVALPSDSVTKPITDDTHCPAVIYVFKKGDPAARATFLQVLPAWKAQNAEVNLALAFESEEKTIGVSLPNAETPQGRSDDSDTDDFFADNGFEYVLAHATSASPDDEVSILGIPRLIDALSSIKWPSLVRNDPSKSIRAAPNNTTLTASLEIAENPSTIGGSTSLNVSTEHLSDEVVLSLFASRIHGGTIDEKHIEALEEWLEEAPTPDPQGDFEESLPAMKTPKAFTDDFGEYFSDPTPRNLPKDISPFATPVPRSSELSKSSGATKEGGYFVDDHPKAWDPTKREIESTTHRIFGGSTNSSSSDLRDIGFDGSDDEDIRFDLSQVFAQLQATKEEISHIKDPQEKRRAAAKAALELVHGLGLESEPESDADSESDIGELLGLR